MTLTDLELIAFLSVPFARPAPVLAGLAEIVSNGEALRLGLRSHAQYEAERAAFVQGLAALARLPGGVTFGRLHFGE